LGNTVFVGSNTPVVLQDNVIVGAGTVVTESAPKDSLVMGSPSKKILIKAQRAFGKNEKNKGFSCAVLWSC